MIKFESDCVDCGFPCIGKRCQYYRQLHLYCDRCGNEEEVLYQDRQEQLCKECYLETAERITIEEVYYREVE